MSTSDHLNHLRERAGGSEWDRPRCPLCEARYLFLSADGEPFVFRGRAPHGAGEPQCACNPIECAGCSAAFDAPRGTPECDALCPSCAKEELQC